MTNKSYIYILDCKTCSDQSHLKFWMKTCYLFNVFNNAYYFTFAHIPTSRNGVLELLDIGPNPEVMYVYIIRNPYSPNCRIRAYYCNIS